MRVAVIAPPHVPVPPAGYGGTERIVDGIVRKLDEMGHEVILFAIKGSEPPPHGRLARITYVPLNENPNSTFHANVMKGRRLRAYLDIPRRVRDYQVDIVHNHVELPVLRPMHAARRLWRTSLPPMLTTLHNYLDSPECRPLNRYADEAYISISDSQRAGNPKLNFAATVYNGTDVELFPYRPAADAEPYLAFLGRMDASKGVREAIEVAAKTGLRLKIAARLAPYEQDYYREVVKPLLKKYQHLVEYIGEVKTMADKAELLGGAIALINPIRWAEPFGLNNVEAMACGTPAIATAFGAIPEIVQDGKTGLVCHNPQEMVRRIQAGELSTISRAACRRHVEKNFSYQVMTERYVEVYERAIHDRHGLRRPTDHFKRLRRKQLSLF
jgi:glycosyltransferase involved in cell wall biosynthesis